MSNESLPAAGQSDERLAPALLAVVRETLLDLQRGSRHGIRVT